MTERSLPVLSPNGRKLIQKLAALPRAWLTAAALAEAIGVSRRTVLRELPGVEQWLTAAGFRFLRSPGQGLLLDEEDRVPLLALLEERAAPEVPREQRRRQLLGLLLAAREPRKAYALSRELSASEHTLSTDLQWAENWLQPFEVRLCRRPGVGFWLEGTPDKRRRAASALLRAHFPGRSLREARPLSFPGLLSHETAEKTWDILRAFEREEGLFFTDAGFFSLALHCALSIEQLRRDDWAPSPTEKVPSLQRALRLKRKLEEGFGIPLPDAETRCLALYLNAYGGAPDEDDWGRADELELRDIAMQLILSVERTLGVDLGRYPSLPEDLCAHLRPMLYRMEQGVPVENPQLDVIQNEYAPIWQATRVACDEVEAACGLKHIPDAEAGFLAMHFGAVLERESLLRLRVSAVVVCPSGMASSKFLATQLIKEFPMLHISAIGSIRGLKPEDLHEQSVDLLISTVPVEIDFPHVCVNTILQEQDRALLRDAVQSIQALPATKPRRAATADDLRYAGQLSAALLELLASLRIETVHLPASRGALITAAANLFAPADPSAVERALLRRDELSDTYIKPLWALLLHCKTNQVAGCRLGYLRAEPPVYENGKVIRGAIVLLAPDVAESVPLEVMQAVSALLIEDPTLIESLRKNDPVRAASILEQGLNRSFRDAISRKWRRP